jgi:hypothetical protein
MNEEMLDGDWFAPESVTRWLAERPADFASCVPVIWQRLAEGGWLGSGR